MPYTWWLQRERMPFSGPWTKPLPEPLSGSVKDTQMSFPIPMIVSSRRFSPGRERYMLHEKVEAFPMTECVNLQ